jgi:hypothetical protein
MFFGNVIWIAPLEQYLWVQDLVRYYRFLAFIQNRAMARGNRTCSAGPAREDVGLALSGCVLCWKIEHGGNGALVSTQILELIGDPPEIAAYYRQLVKKFYKVTLPRIASHELVDRVTRRSTGSARGRWAPTLVNR